MAVKEWLPLKKAARELGLSHSHVRHMVNTKQWPAEQIGRDWFIHVNVIEGIKAERETNPPKTGPKRGPKRRE